MSHLHAGGSASRLAFSRAFAVPRIRPQSASRRVDATARRSRDGDDASNDAPGAHRVDERDDDGDDATRESTARECEESENYR